MKIQTDKKEKHCRPDIVIQCNKARKFYVVDVVCPSGTRVKTKRGTCLRIQKLKRGLGHFSNHQRNVGDSKQKLQHWSGKLDIMENLSTSQILAYLDKEDSLRRFWIPKAGQDRRDIAIVSFSNNIKSHDSLANRGS